MRDLSLRGHHRLCTTAVIRTLGLVALFACGGCSNLTPGIFSHPGDAPRLSPMGSGVELTNLESAEIYHKVREAAAQNSVVLEVVGEKQSIRVLPLPPEGQTVFVSNLLTETGVMKKLGTVEATLYRNSPQAVGGVRMDVKMSPAANSVRPESDYALRPGDRLRVRKVEHAALTSLINATIGL